MQSTVDQDYPASLRERQGPLGHVIAVRGSQASVGLSATLTRDADEPRVTVGKFLGVRVDRSLLIGVVTDVSLRTEPVAREQDYITVAALDVIGEITDVDGPGARFRRGVSAYPGIGDRATFVGSRELRLIFNISGPSVIDVGELQQDGSIGAYVDVTDMLSKHSGASRLRSLSLSGT